MGPGWPRLFTSEISAGVGDNYLTSIGSIVARYRPQMPLIVLSFPSVTCQPEHLSPRQLAILTAVVFCDGHASWLEKQANLNSFYDSHEAQMALPSPGLSPSFRSVMFMVCLSSSVSALRSMTAGTFHHAFYTCLQSTTSHEQLPRTSLNVTASRPPFYPRQKSSAPAHPSPTTPYASSSPRLATGPSPPSPSSSPVSAETTVHEPCPPPPSSHERSCNHS